MNHDTNPIFPNQGSGSTRNQLCSALYPRRQSKEIRLNQASSLNQVRSLNQARHSLSKKGLTVAPVQLNTCATHGWRQLCRIKYYNGTAAGTHFAKSIARVTSRQHRRTAANLVITANALLSSSVLVQVGTGEQRSPLTPPHHGSWVTHSHVGNTSITNGVSCPGSKLQRRPILQFRPRAYS